MNLKEWLKHPETKKLQARILALEEKGRVVVTWADNRTRIVAVTRQDDEGRILKIIACVPKSDSSGEIPVHTITDVEPPPVESGFSLFGELK